MRKLTSLGQQGGGTFYVQALVTLSGTIVLNVFNYVYHMASSRLLGVDAYGTLTTLVAITIVFGVPGSILQIVVAKYTAEFRAVNDRPRIGRLIALTLSRGSAAALAVTLAGITLAPFVAPSLHVANVLAVALAAPIIGMNLLAYVLRGVLQGLEDFNRYAISIVPEGVGKVVFGLGFVALGTGVSGAIGGYALGTAVTLAYTVWAARRYLQDEPVPLHVDVRRLWQTMSGTTAATFAITILGFADVIVVKHFLDSRSAGLYGAVALLGKVLIFLTSFAPTVLLPKAASRSVARQAATPLLLQTLAATSAISLATIAVCALFPALVVRVLAGPAYAAAAPYVLPYAVAATALGTANVLSSYRISLHRYGFTIPLLLVAAGEIAAFFAMHDSLATMTRILMIGHCCALAATLVPMPRFNLVPSLRKGHVG